MKKMSRRVCVYSIIGRRRRRRIADHNCQKGHVLVIDFINLRMSMLYKAKANGAIKDQGHALVVYQLQKYSIMLGRKFAHLAANSPSGFCITLGMF
ncbi:unnamed protein product [Camellia sinensis]